MNQEKSKFIKHRLPCPKCGSSDAVSMNADNSAYCFSCSTFFTDYETASEGRIVETTQKPTNTFLESYTGIYGELTDRGISEQTAKKFGVRVIKNRNGDITQHIYPYFNGNEVAITKTRFVADKNFATKGTFEGTGLFGEQLYRNTGGKYLTITEGECDAMAVDELFQGKWAVVSLKRGAAGAVKDIRESIEFVESFDNVVLCFDNDKAGREASRNVARILKPGKVKIMTLPTATKMPMTCLNKKNFKALLKLGGKLRLILHQVSWNCLVKKITGLTEK